MSSVPLLALQGIELSIGVVLAIGLFGLLLIPFLLAEIQKGKRSAGLLRRLGRGGTVAMGPPTPFGSGDNNPGRRGDPAPGQPDGQADPYGARAQRHGPPIRS